MANLTKEQRLAREAEKEAALKAEIEKKIRKEYEEKLKAEMNDKNSFVEDFSNKSVRAKTIQNTVRIPLDTIVPVTCNVKGKLIYVSKKISGYTINWDNFGSTEYMDLAELVSMRNSDRRFFEDNWIICEDTDEYSAMQIYDFLKVTKYYEHVFTPENIDSVFDLTPNDIIRIVSALSNGMKETIAVRAKEKIDLKELDSNSKIEALEAALSMVFSI